MADITTVWNVQAGEGGWVVEGPALQAGDDLATAVLISLFTDRQAAADDPLPDGSGDRRGWWGDPEMGSRLWLLSRAKQTAETARRAQEYAAEALAWMIDDGVAASVSPKAAWLGRGQLGLTVTISRADGSSRALEFAWAWGG